MIREYFGAKTAGKIAILLIENSMPFDINPIPCDVFEFNIKDERVNLLPPENVRRDALVESGSDDAPLLTCKYCGREYESDDGLAEGDPCPSDDCPSHEYVLPEEDAMMVCRTTMADLYNNKIDNDKAVTTLAGKLSCEALAELLVSTFNRGWISRFNLGIDEDGKLI